MPGPHLSIKPHLAARRDLKWTDKACLMAINYRQGRNENCWPSYDTIAGDLGISRRQAINSVRKLRKAKLIEVEKRITGEKAWHSNLYTVVSQNMGGSADSALGGERFALGGSAKSAPRTIKGMKRDAAQRKIVTIPAANQTQK